MGTEMNLDLIKDMGMSGPELEGATANDLIIAVDAADEKTVALAEQTVDEKLRQKSDQGDGDSWRPGSSAAAVEAIPDANLVVISLPGQYAARETRKMLSAGKHVMLFSDNVSLDDEIALKKLAREKGLLMMGPDCGTAIINGKPLCFANVVPRGPVGVVSASGTGSGVSQGIGTGGRDLKSEKVGGSTTLAAIEALAADPETKVIVVISKPPAPAVAETVISALKKTGKPAVIHLIGLVPETRVDGNLHFAGNLEEVARMAAALAEDHTYRPRLFDAGNDEIDAIVERETSGISSQQKYLRGYFTGLQARGSPEVGQAHHRGPRGGRLHRRSAPSDDRPLHANGADGPGGVGRRGSGRPAGLRDRLRQPPRSGGRHGSIDQADEGGGYLAVVASITGTEGDFQNFSAQKRTLEDAGVVVMPSNHQATQLAGRIMAELDAR